MRKLNRKWRRRRFLKAVRILQKESERHKKAEHIMDFRAINESLVLMRCTACPDLQPHGVPKSRRKKK